MEAAGAASAAAKVVADRKGHQAAIQTAASEPARSVRCRRSVHSAPPHQEHTLGGQSGQRYCGRGWMSAWVSPASSYTVAGSFHRSDEGPGMPTSTTSIGVIMAGPVWCTDMASL